jgi:tetratricopeptide (TPR) repeat protein
VTGDGFGASGTGEESATSWTVDEPGASGTGEDPATSGALDEPGASGTGEEPATSETLDESGASGTGEEPATSETGEESATSGTGEESVTSGTGEESVTSGTGEESVTSGTGEEPVTSVTGDEPVTSGDGEEPVTSGTGEESVTSGTGDESVTSGTGEESVTSGDGEEPVTSVTGDEPVTYGDGEEPVTSVTGDEPVTSGTGDGPGASGAGEEPVTSVTGDGPVTSGDAPGEEPCVPPLVPSAETLELLARHGDEAAFGAAAGAAACAVALGALGLPEAFVPPFSMSAMAEKVSIDTDFPAQHAYGKLCDAAASRLGPLSPASLCLAWAFWETRLSDMASLDRLLRTRRDFKLFRDCFGPFAGNISEKFLLARSSLGTRSPTTLRTEALLAGALFRLRNDLGAAGHFAWILDELEGCAPGDAPPVPAIAPGRRGRDQMAMRAGVARCLRRRGDPASVAALLAPLADALRDIPPGGGWPCPPELAGRALVMAGEAACGLGDLGKAEELLRRSLDALDPGLADPDFLGAALDLLAAILAVRGDPDSLREAAGLQARASGLIRTLDGRDSALSLEMLSGAAGLLECAGDADGALELHREVLAGRERLKDPSAMDAGPSRAAVERLEGRTG